MAAYPVLKLDPDRPWTLSPRIGASTPLATVISVYIETLAQDGVSPNTVSAFEADLRLFCDSAGMDVPIGEVGAEHGEQFRRFLTKERGVACSPSSLRRRLTAVQSLFRYLIDEGVVQANPIVSTTVQAPTPNEPGGDMLTEEEAAALVEAAAAEAGEGDWRPLLLATLLLSSGISKAEALSLDVTDIDPDSGTLSVGRDDRRRTVDLDPQVVEAFLGFRESHSGEGRLFDCTGRNLEYVLARTGRNAGLSRNPSFRALRATAAARLHDSGADNQEMAERLGISRHTWPALRRRIQRASSR